MLLFGYFFHFMLTEIDPIKRRSRYIKIGLEVSPYVSDNICSQVQCKGKFRFVLKKLHCDVKLFNFIQTFNKFKLPDWAYS